MATELQPQFADCWSPSTARPMPAETRIAPRQSIGTGRRMSAGLARQVSQSARSATGTLMRKIARQVHGSRKLPAIGPIDVNAPLMPKKSASAFPRSRAANALKTIASAAGKSSAPNAPCSSRETTSHSCAAAPFGVTPHSTEARAKPTVPTITIRRCPTTSLSFPPSAMTAASASR